MAQKGRIRKVSLHISASELGKVLQDRMVGVRFEAIITHANVKMTVETDEGKQMEFRASSQRLS